MCLFFVLHGVDEVKEDTIKNLKMTQRQAGSNRGVTRGVFSTEQGAEKKTLVRKLLFKVD